VYTICEEKKTVFVILPNLPQNLHVLFICNSNNVLSIDLLRFTIKSSLFSKVYVWFWHIHQKP